MKLSRALAAVALSVALASTASATIVINITARQLSADSGATVPLVDGTLIQLLNLGPDGIFNRVDLNDGNVAGLAQWVSGDDSLISATLLNATDAFTTAAAFDMIMGADATAGRLSRQFEFATGAIASGTKLGIRWWPGLQAANFQSITLAPGQAFGEFTRQSTPLYGLDLWVAPADGAQVTFDNLKTTNQAGGLDALSLGRAGQQGNLSDSLTVIPEPAAIGLSMLAAAGLTLLRRRRA